MLKNLFSCVFSVSLIQSAMDLTWHVVLAKTIRLVQPLLEKLSESAAHAPSGLKENGYWINLDVAIFPAVCSRLMLKMMSLKTAQEITMRVCALDANKPNITECIFHITVHAATPTRLMLSFWTDFYAQLCHSRFFCFKRWVSVLIHVNESLALTMCYIINV